MNNRSPDTVEVPCIILDSYSMIDDTPANATVQMSQSEIDAFNSKLQSLPGEPVSREEAIDMLRKVFDGPIDVRFSNIKPRLFECGKTLIQ